jgi:uncharacterized protein YjbI with pentapeptide repeats
VANEGHVKILKQGVKVWNAWRDANDLRPDLSAAKLINVNLNNANLIGANLFGADLNDANLTDANLSNANLAGANPALRPDLSGANLTDANLRGAKLDAANLSDADVRRANLSDASLWHADLSDASLWHADLSSANLSGADLTFAHLTGTYLSSANLSGADMTRAGLDETVFVNVDLASVIGLDTCIHYGPSPIDYRTLQKSGPLPLKFLRGVGLPDLFIDYLPSLLNQAIQHYSCFISYSTHDEEFAKRLHSDLQDKGVRCWFAPHDLRIGKKILDAVDAAIRLRDRVLLILSERSINSEWVEDEVTAGFEEERKRKEEVLFPIRLDDAVMETGEAWAAKLRARLIGDFRQWKNHDAYQQSFQRILRDLTKDQTAPRGTAEGDV